MAFYPKQAGTANNTFDVGLNKLRLDSSNLTTTRTLKFPNSNGSSGQALVTDGAGNLTWVDVPVGSNYVLKAGDTMTGTLILPTNGLVAGTNQFVLSGGNVGIGTASPSGKLDVSSAVTTTVNFTSTSTSNVDFCEARITGNDNLLRLSSYGSTHLSRSNTCWINANGSTQALVVATANTERMRVTPVGEVVIGSAAASGAALVVNGSIRSFRQGDRTNLAITIDSTNGAPTWTQRNLIGHYFTGTLDATSVRVPSSTLTNTGSYDVFSDGSHAWYGAGGSNNTGSTATAWMRLTNTGNLIVNRLGSSSIGTGNAKLSVSASTGAADCALFIDNFGDGLGYGVQSQLNPSAVGGTGWHFACYNTSGTQNGGIYQNSTTTVAFNTSSDERLKTNIVDTPSQGDKFDNMRVRDFEFKEDIGRVVTGFIAQELYDVVPAAVTVGGDNEKTHPWSVDFSKLVPLLVKEVQDLRARVAQLESKGV